MLFNSFDFVLFFPTVVAIYFAIPQKVRWGFLLAASYYFYACWKAEYLILIIISTLIDYWAGLQMGKLPTKEKRWPYLLVSLTGNLGILFSFKYFNFFNDSLRVVFQQFNIMYEVPGFDLLLPVGISFYTFQSLSYSIDIYKGDMKPERHLGIFALYVSFFPQLVAGPIERSQQLLPQFRKTHHFDYQRVTDGLKLVTWGFFKKLFIADRIALYVNEVFNNPGDYSGLPVAIASFLFLIQLYCDFSGYTDIAIGTARVMGYELMENFRRPFFARTIQDFWDRWHISMTTWFKDYLFQPLAWRKRITKFRWYSSLMLTFIFIGLWHGAKWTFVILGVLQGIFLICGALTSPYRQEIWEKLLSQWSNKAAVAIFDKSRILLGIAITISLVTLSLTVFRANSLSDCIVLLSQLITNFTLDTKLVIGMAKFDFALALAGIALLFLVHLIEEKHDKSIILLLNNRIKVFRWAVYFIVFIFTIVGGQFGATEFIYFQF